MGELVDYNLLLATSHQEADRMRAAQAQDARQVQARRARERAMAGSPQARKALAAGWAPLAKTALQTLPDVKVYEGVGPPVGPPPAGTVGFAYYRDTTTDILYRWETQA